MEAEGCACGRVMVLNDRSHPRSLSLMSRTPLLLSVPRVAVAALALLLSVDLSAQGGGSEGAYQKQLDGLRAEL